MSYNYSLNNLRTNSPYYSLNNLNTENGLKDLIGEHPVETSINGSTGTIYLYESSANLIDFAAFNKSLKVVDLVANTLSINTLATNNLTVANLIDTSGIIVRNNLSINGRIDASALFIKNNLSVFGNIDASALFIKNNLSVNGILEASGVNIRNNLSVSNSFINTLSVNSAILNNLSITSVTIPTVNTNALFVNGNASVSGTLDLGNTLFGNYIKGTKLDLTSTANQRHIYQSSANGENYFGAKVACLSTLEAVGKTTLYNTLSVANNTYISNALSVSGTVSLGPIGAYIAPEVPSSNSMKIYTPNTLYLSGGAAAAKDITINQSGDLKTNDVYVNGNLSVFSSLTANTVSISSGSAGNLSIGGNLRVNGSVSVNSTLHTNNQLGVVNTKWSTNGNDVFINASGDTIYLRPFKDTSTNQATLNTSGLLTVPSLSVSTQYLGSSLTTRGNINIINNSSSGFLNFYQDNGTSQIVSIQPGAVSNILAFYKGSQNQVSMIMNDTSGMTFSGPWAVEAQGYLYGSRIYPAVGSAAAPSYTFNQGSKNTGLFTNASAVLGFSTIGVERFRISNTGLITLGNISNDFYIGFNPQIDTTVTVLGCRVAKNGSTTGSYNTCVGFESQRDLTSGVYNSSFGAGSLNSITTGFSNVAMGLNAGRAITTGGNNVAIGMNTLFTDVSGSSNTCIGYGAGYSNTRDFGISFAGGASSLGSNTTGQFNVAVGVNSLGQDTSNSCNTAVGHNAGMYSRGGSNIAIGFECMPCYSDRYRTNANDYNVGIGRATFYDISATNFNANTAIGGNNMTNPKNTVNNTACGYASLLALQTGGQNCAFGAQAGYSLTTGSNNCLIGFAAGTNQLTNGINNTFVGNYSGVNNSGNNNVCVGYASLNGPGGAGSNGSYNTILGFQGGDNLTNGSANILIGYAARPASVSAQYRLMIGDAYGGIYGTGLYRNFGVGPVIFKGGVNNLDPAYVWDVSGNFRSTVAGFTTETIPSLYTIGASYQYRQDGSGAYRPYCQTRNRNLAYGGSAAWQLVLQDQIIANNCDDYVGTPIWVFYASFTGSYRFSYGISGYNGSTASFFHTDIYINGVSQNCIQYNTIANAGWYVSNSDSKIFKMNRNDQIQIRLQTNNGATVQAQSGATLEFLG